MDALLVLLPTRFFVFVGVDDSRSRFEEEEDVIRPFNSQEIDITEKNLVSPRNEIQDCI